MATLTKENLKKELVACGIPLPSSNAKKDELVHLYEKYVAHNTTPRKTDTVTNSQSKSSLSFASEFSSDEAEGSPQLERKSYGSGAAQDLKEADSMVNLVVGDVNINELSDDELFSRLKALNVDVGPIVDSTRAVYRRKLARILQGVDRGEEMEYSDTDEEEPEEMKYSSTSAGLRNQLLSGSYEQNYRTTSYEFRRYAHLEDGGGSNIRPRVSLDPEYLRSRAGRVDDFVSRIVDQEKEPISSWQSLPSTASKGTKSCRRGLSSILLIGIVVILILVAFLVYQNMESSESSSIPEIGEL